MAKAADMTEKKLLLYNCAKFTVNSWGGQGICSNCGGNGDMRPANYMVEQSRGYRALCDACAAKRFPEQKMVMDAKLEGAN